MRYNLPHLSGRSRIARLKYNAKKRVAATKTIPFGLLGHPKNSCEFCKRDLTAWGGGADPANNSYKIHDCSCNAPFTGNNPCMLHIAFDIQ